MKCAHESLYTLSKLMENTKTVQRLRSPDNWIRDRYFMKTRINNFYPRLPVSWQIIVAAGFEGYDADAEKTNGCRLKLSSLYFVMFGQWIRSKTSSAIDAEWVSEWEYKFRCAMVTSRMGTRAVPYVAVYVANIDPNVKSNSHVSRTHTFIREYEWEKTTYVYYNYYKSAWAEHTKTLLRLCCCTSYSKRFMSQGDIMSGWDSDDFQCIQTYAKRNACSPTPDALSQSTWQLHMAREENIPNYLIVVVVSTQKSKSNSSTLFGYVLWFLLLFFSCNLVVITYLSSSSQFIVSECGCELWLSAA